MKMSIKNLWREPLLHFLLIGVALFVFYNLTNEQGSEAPNRIVISSSQVEQLAAYGIGSIAVFWFIERVSGS